MSSDSSGVTDMYNGDLSQDVADRFDRIREYMSDKGNHICPRCGSDLTGAGCLRCSSCGYKDCNA